MHADYEITNSIMQRPDHPVLDIIRESEVILEFNCHIGTDGRILQNKLDLTSLMKECLLDPPFTLHFGGVFQGEINDDCDDSGTIYVHVVIARGADILHRFQFPCLLQWTGAELTRVEVLNIADLERKVIILTNYPMPSSEP